MPRASIYRPTLLAMACLMLGSCGGDDSGGARPPVAIGGGAPTPTPTPTPTPPPSDPPATTLLPPAPFGLTASAEFSLVGWQETSQKDAHPLVALAEHKGTLAWSEDLKTYAIMLADLGSGRLVYSFPPSNNSAAFSIVQADGSVAKVYVTIFVRSANVGEVYWQTADRLTPFVYARAMFGIPTVIGSLPTTGRREFTTDTNPQSSIIIDYAIKKVSGTVTSFNDGGGWDPAGPKEQATIEPADLQLDGSFVAAITVPGASKKGELRGRLFGPAGTELGVYWNAPVRNGNDGAFGEWRAVMAYPACSSCSG